PPAMGSAERSSAPNDAAAAAQFTFRLSTLGWPMLMVVMRTVLLPAASAAVKLAVDHTSQFAPVKGIERFVGRLTPLTVTRTWMVALLPFAKRTSMVREPAAATLNDHSTKSPLLLVKSR